jgi:DNA-directed RNA polymerase subunit M/transcription elongation factor TFIIS
MQKNKEGKLIHYCKFCHYQDPQLINTKNFKVFEFKSNNTEEKININEYTRYDPSLPHVNTIKCPNVECKSNGGSLEVDNAEGGVEEKKGENNSPPVKQDVIYFRIDDTNMKYVYLCYHCNFSWRP